MSEIQRRVSGMTKLSLLCATSAIAIAASTGAQAQDASTAGLYAGIHAGYASGTLSGSAMYGVDSGTLADGPSFGGLFGGQVGYNFDTGSNLLLGGELSASLGNSSDSQVQSNFGGSGDTLSFERKLTGLALAQAKLGWTEGGVAIYGLGGVALAAGSIDGGVSDNEGTTSFSGNTTYNGWTLGVGIDMEVTENVSLGAAYNYVSLVGDDVEDNGIVVEQDLDSHIAKLVLNYHF